MEAHGGADPDILIVPEHMSDEASGPEDIDAESKLDWKRRMTDHHGLGGFAMSDDEIRRLPIHFLEVCVPKWRSERVSSR